MIIGSSNLVLGFFAWSGLSKGLKWQITVSGDFHFLLNDWRFSLHSLCCLLCCVFVCIFFSICVIVWIYVFRSVSLPDQCCRAFNLHPFPESLVSLILFNNAACTGYSFIFPPQYKDMTTITFPSQGNTGQAFFRSWKIFILYFGSVIVRTVQIWPWPYSTQYLYSPWFLIESIHNKKRVRGNKRRRWGRDPSSLHTQSLNSPPSLTVLRKTQINGKVIQLNALKPHLGTFKLSYYLYRSPPKLFNSALENLMNFYV